MKTRFAIAVIFSLSSLLVTAQNDESIRSIEVNGSAEIKIQPDEIKFVIGNREDYEWAKEIIKQYDLTNKCSILFSVVFGELEPVTLVEWILEDNLQVRFQLQMHKFIWDPVIKGV